MHENVTKAIGVLTSEIVRTRKSVLLLPKQEENSVQIVIDEKADVYVTQNRIIITASATEGNLKIPGYRSITDKKRIAFDCGVIDSSEVKRAADIINRLD